MKQFQFGYQNMDKLTRELRKIRQWSSSRIVSHIVFHIFTEQHDRTLIGEICAEIGRELPEAEYLGCSTNGNIMNGAISHYDTIITCTLFEYQTTMTELIQYPLSKETAGDVTADLVLKLRERPWVKAVELLTTIRGMSMTGFCRELGKAAPEIQIFGGGAFSYDMDDNRACVFSREGGWSDSGVVFWLIGGDDLSVTSAHITGWKPLGRTFHVTKANGSTLYELDGNPAYEVYYKYLNIKNNEHFFTNSLEFPFFYEHNGINLLRAPTASNEDGSLTMTSDIEENVLARLAYGDPATVLESVRNDGRHILKFRPEVIHIFSCAARRTFWGSAEVSKESLPFQNIAPTSGFYTSGEFLRTKGFVNQHNVTLVVAALREGEPVGKLPENAELEVDNEDFSGKVSLINRLANYINAAFRDLEISAVTDGLTKLYNRAEIQRRIAERLSSGKPLSLIMIDIDNFKQVNDAYGHQEGDGVIVGLAGLLQKTVAEFGGETAAGRWGGEEFMIVMPFGTDCSVKVAETLCSSFSKMKFEKAGSRTISLGVTGCVEGESLDELLIRVDMALYEAKRTGKNRVVLK